MQVSERKSAADDLAAVIVVAINARGECTIEGRGDLANRHAEGVAANMVLFAAKLRNASRARPSLKLV